MKSDLSSAPSDAAARVACAMCIRCAELEETVLQLRAELRGRDAWQPPASLRLTFGESAVLQALYARDRWMTREALWEATRGQPNSRDGSTWTSTVQVHISRMRRKLKPHGIEIENQHGHGYRLSPASRMRLRAMSAQERAAA